MAGPWVLLFSLTLALGGALLLLWDMAARQRRRQTANQTLAKKMAREGAALAAELRFGAPPALEEPPQVARKRELFPMPEWLLGALSSRQLLIGGLLIVAAVVVAGTLSSWIGAAGLLALLLTLGAFYLWTRVQKIRTELIRQLPGFLDIIARLIVVGNSTQAAFQMAIPSVQPPLRQQMDNAMSLVRAGLDIDQALQQVANKVRFEEMQLLASIMGLGVRYGGRSDVLLERVAHFMRDREEMEHELVAMSAETRMSAWVLGLLPLVVGAAIITINGAYFARLWDDGTGRQLVLGAAGLQALGVYLLYRLSRLE